MAFGTMTSLLGMIPLLAIGMNFYRYQSVDPENKVQEPTVVSCNHPLRIKSIIYYLILTTLKM